MVSAHLLNFAILFAPMIGTFAGEKMNSAVVSYATVAILLLGIMFWRQKSYCKEKNIEYGELFTDFSVLFIVGYIVAPMIARFIPILKFLVRLPFFSVIGSGIIFLLSFLLFKLFTKTPCS
jgi:hypothetical protein